jgi:hypothetical protein
LKRDFDFMVNVFPSLRLGCLAAPGPSAGASASAEGPTKKVTDVDLPSKKIFQIDGA